MYLNWKSNAKAYWVVDTETDGLNPTKFHCAVAKNLGSKEILEFNPEAMYDGRFKRFIDSCGYIIGHNFISYDMYHCGRLLGLPFTIEKIIDSLVLSYLYHPHLPDGHSLEAYGNRFKIPKLGHEDWSHFSSEMMARCRRDVEINELTYLGLCDRMNKIGFSEKSCEIEHRIRYVIDKQERRGVHYNREGAEKLIDRLSSELEQLSDPIQALFPPTLEPIKSYNYRLKKDGSEFASFLRHQEEYDAIKFNESGSEYTTYSYKPFSIGSSPQRIQKLLSLGWTPTEFTDAGNPKVDADALEEFAREIDDNRIKLISDWMVRSSRKSNVEGLIKLIGPDGRLHGRVFTCGASSRRMRHADPNPTLTPRLTTTLGPECRELWDVEDTSVRCLVGYDASGLEMRMFAHHMGGRKEIVELYVVGKPHKVNAASMSSILHTEATTDHSKKSFYSMIYGAYDKRLGNDFNNGGPKVGSKIRQALLSACPGLEEATDNAQAEWNANGGLLRTIDGGFVRCPSANSALNYKLQPDGAIAMKLSAIKLDDYLVKNGLDSHMVINAHDEVQLDTAKEIAREVGEMGIQTIKDAGEELNFKVPLTGEWSSGPNWRYTH